MKSGHLNFLEPSGPLQACNGTALLLPLHSIILDTIRVHPIRWEWSKEMLLIQNIKQPVLYQCTFKLRTKLHGIPCWIHHPLVWFHSFISIQPWRPGLAGTSAQSCNRHDSGTLHPGQVLGGSLPLLSPLYDLPLMKIAGWSYDFSLLTHNVLLTVIPNSGEKYTVKRIRNGTKLRFSLNWR